MKKILKSPSETFDCWLLQNEEEYWFIDIAGRVYPIDSNEFEVKMSLLPFLEIDYDDLPSVMRSANVSLPLYSFIKAAFIHGSKTWIDDGLQWLKRLEVSEINKFKDELRQIEDNKKFSQSTRHLARKLLHKT